MEKHEIERKQLCGHLEYIWLHILGIGNQLANLLAAFVDPSLKSPQIRQERWEGHMNLYTEILKEFVVRGSSGPKKIPLQTNKLRGP